MSFGFWWPGWKWIVTTSSSVSWQLPRRTKSLLKRNLMPLLRGGPLQWYQLVTRFTSLRGLFLDGVTANFVFSLLGNIMPDFTRRLTHWLANAVLQDCYIHGWYDAIRTYGGWCNGNNKAAYQTRGLRWLSHPQMDREWTGCNCWRWGQR